MQTALAGTEDDQLQVPKQQLHGVYVQMKPLNGEVGIYGGRAPGCALRLWGQADVHSNSNIPLLANFCKYICYRLVHASHHVKVAASKGHGILGPCNW